MNILTGLALVAILTSTTVLSAFDGGNHACDDISELIQLKKGSRI